MVVDLPAPDPEQIMAENGRIDRMLREHEALLHRTRHHLVSVSELLVHSPDAEMKHSSLVSSQLAEEITEHLGV